MTSISPADCTPDVIKVMYKGMTRSRISPQTGKEYSATINTSVKTINGKPDVEVYDASRYLINNAQVPPRAVVRLFIQHNGLWIRDGRVYHTFHCKQIHLSEENSNFKGYFNLDTEEIEEHGENPNSSNIYSTEDPSASAAGFRKVEDSEMKL